MLVQLPDGMLWISDENTRGAYALWFKEITFRIAFQGYLRYVWSEGQFAPLCF